MAALAPRQMMNEWTTDPKEILETFAAEMRANQRHYSIYGGNYAIVIPKHLREHIQAAGWTKRDIAEFIYERARIRRGEWAEVGKGAIGAQPRGENPYGTRIAGSSLGRRRRRPGWRVRRGHSTLDGQQDQGCNGSHRCLCRLRAAERVTTVTMSARSPSQHEPEASP